MLYGCNRVAPSIAAGGRSPRRHGVQGAAACPAPCSHRTPAKSPGGCGGTGARLASHAGQVARGPRRHRRAARVARRPGRQGAAASPARGSHHTQAGSAGGGGGSGALLAPRRSIVTMRAQIALRRRARGVALANHARTRVSRYGGHSKNSSWASMAHGVAPSCLSSVLGLFHVEHQPRCATGGQVDPQGGAGAGGALLRAPITARPLAACRVRALPWHGQAGGSGRGAGGAAARRGRIWGACRRGRALQKM